MKTLKEFEVWFITGSQHLYGPETLKQVDADSKHIADALNVSSAIPCKVVFKPVLKSPDEITKICVEANTTPELYWPGDLDAYLQPCQNVDRRIVAAAKTVRSSAHAVQPRYPVGRD